MLNQLMVDGLIVGLLVWFAVVGYRRGFIIEAVDLMGFVVAVLAASVFHRPVGQLLVQNFQLPPSFAAVGAYAILVITVEVIYLLAVRRLLHKLPSSVTGSRPNLIGGGMMNALKGLMLIAVGVIVFAGLPLAAEHKEAVTKAAIPSRLLSSTGELQRRINGLVGSGIADTLNFFTVHPESHETITLGFATDRVREDPAAEEQILGLINEERTSRGLKALRPNTVARAVARSHSRDMFARGYFSHVNPEGQDPFDRMRSGGVEFRAAGENLALAPTTLLAHRGLMNSPGHRANILSPDFGAVGIGVINSGRYGLMVTQNFTD
jgi:uncharacterized protein YkwD